MLPLNDDFSEYSIVELEHLQSKIKIELDQLAQNTFRGGVGNLGWMSTPHDTPENTEWVRIQLDGDPLIDQIALLPIIWHDSKNGFQSDAFPSKLKVIAGTKANPEGIEIASFANNQNMGSQLAPLILDFEPIHATWIRVEATRLSPRLLDGQPIFQLSEIFIFSGQKIVSLKQPITVSSSSRNNRVTNSAQKEMLVDGIGPYLMDSAQGKQSDAFETFFERGLELILTIDLETDTDVDGITLHAADVSRNVPQIHHADYGIPKHLIVEGSRHADFSKAVPLLEYHRETAYTAGPIIMMNFPKFSGRYLRFKVLDAYKAPEATDRWRCVGLAEIEILSQGKNRALGKKVEVASRGSLQEGNPEPLTDGRNHFGKILSTRDWLNQLARRQYLETKLTDLTDALNVRYEQQRQLLNRMTWLAALFAAGIIISVLISRLLQMRQIARLKERLAADLHDELGANLHSIGLLSDIARDAETAEEWQVLSQRIRELTERSGSSVQHCTNMLESAKLEIGLIAEMRRTAERIATNLQHSQTIEGETFLEDLTPRTRFDLFLFYKEALVNICRHSGANQIHTTLKADKNNISLRVSDNGTGLPAGSAPPPSLARRAKLLNAKLKVQSAPEGGTLILLNIRKSPWYSRIFPINTFS